MRVEEEQTTERTLTPIWEIIPVVLADFMAKEGKNRKGEQLDDGKNEGNE